MKTRINRAGVKQCLLAVWIEQADYFALERVAKERRTTVADLIRAMLPGAFEAEAERKELADLVQQMIAIKDADLEDLARRTGSATVKNRVLHSIRRHKLKEIERGLTEFKTPKKNVK